jgi:hypothetical protein
MFLLVAEAARRLWINPKHMLLENDGKETLQTILKSGIQTKRCRNGY